MFGRCYAPLPERSSLSSITANGGDGSGGQLRYRSKRSVWKAGTWCRSICHRVSMLLHRPGMIRAQYLYQRTQQYASRCPAVSPLLAQKQTSPRAQPMSAFGGKADIGGTLRNVRFLPKADIGGFRVVPRRPGPPNPLRLAPTPSRNTSQLACGLPTPDTHLYNKKH